MGGRSTTRAARPAQRQTDPRRKAAARTLCDLERLGWVLRLLEDRRVQVSPPRGVEGLGTGGISPEARRLLAEAGHRREDLVAALSERERCLAAWSEACDQAACLLGPVAYELTERERERIVEREAHVRRAVLGCDLEATRKAIVDWFLAVHPVRWLPHGERFRVSDHYRSHLADYQREVRERGESMCVGQRCGGACRVPEDRTVRFIFRRDPERRVIVQIGPDGERVLPWEPSAEQEAA